MIARLRLSALVIKTGQQLLLSLSLQFGAVAIAQEAPIFSREDIFHPVIGREGMVATQERHATAAGLAVLQAGGNAIDAAVTVGFTLAVTLPRAGNIGGGGFMLIHLADSQTTIALDYREKAPQRATRDMFLNTQGEIDPQKSRFSHLAAGVPGTVAGLALALEKYGTLSLAEALAPAIALAEQGYPVSEEFYLSLQFARHLRSRPASQKIFYPQGEPPAIGTQFRQPDLARSLKLLAQQGTAAFYQGEIGQRLIADMAANGGLITAQDLASYRPALRQPVQGTYRGYQVYSMPPPSSGGVHLIQMLNLLEPFPLQTWGHNTAQTLHVMAETMKLAYRDREEFLGDPDFVPVPIAQLTSKAYANQLRSRINLERPTPSQSIPPGNPWSIRESQETTHYSVIDSQGNAVANTYTLNFSYGSGITIPGTGIILNNQMDDFTAKIGAPNAFGLIGGQFNAIEPEKRMLSSMTPTIVMKDGKPFLVTGSPGGSRIITTTLQIILNVIDHQMNIAEATNAPRIHHQGFPDRLQVESALNGDTLRLLTEKGYAIDRSSAMGSTQSILLERGRMFGASDPRTPDSLTLGY